MGGARAARGEDAIHGGRGPGRVPRDGGASRQGGCSALVGSVLTLSFAHEVGFDKLTRLRAHLAGTLRLRPCVGQNRQRGENERVLQ